MLSLFATAREKKSAPARVVSGAVLLLVACSPKPIHVSGVVRESPEMRPLRNLAADAYANVRVFVHASERSAQGGAECGVAPLEGASEHNNAACIPEGAVNDAVRMVRQRLRSYGMGVVRDAGEPHDYDVQIVVFGIAPEKPDPTLAKAAAKLTFTLQPNAAAGVFAGVDPRVAGVAFEAVARDCALQDADFSTFSAASTLPMTPEFDLSALTSDAVDNAVGCDQLARFFLDARTRYPKAAGSAGPAR